MGRKPKVEKVNTKIVQKQDVLAKSNLFITAKFKLSLDAHKVFYTSLLKFQEKEYVMNEYNQPVVQFSTAELRHSMNSKSTSIYNRLSRIANQISGTQFGFMDPEAEEFAYINVISAATYKEGIFEVTFNPMILNIKGSLTKGGFTLLERNTMMSWTSVYTYRLFELLRQRAYYPSSYTGPKTGLFEATYDVYELRLLLGIVNSNLVEVKRVLESTNPPDYKKACEASPEKMYMVWRDFRASVLLPAIKEINSNELTDLYVDMELKKKSHGEVYAISFLIKTKDYKEDNKANEDNQLQLATSVKDDKANVIVSEEDKFYFICNTIDLFKDYNLKYGDVTTIVEAAKYDFQLLQHIKKILDENTTEIKNLVGWIISMTERVTGNSENIVVEKRRNNKKNQFNDFPQRKYDFIEMEKALMDESFENID